MIVLTSAEIVLLELTAFPIGYQGPSNAVPETILAISTLGKFPSSVGIAPVRRMPVVLKARPSS
jgi:hypothetical protein